MKRILVPIDFSDATLRVIDQACQLATGLDAEIHLVHVKELSAAAAPGAFGYGLAGVPELAPLSGMPGSAVGLMAQPISGGEGQRSKLTQMQKGIAQFRGQGPLPQAT